MEINLTEILIKWVSMYIFEKNAYLICSMGPILGDGTGLDIGKDVGKFLLGGGRMLKITDFINQL